MPPRRASMPSGRWRSLSGAGAVVLAGLVAFLVTSNRAAVTVMPGAAPSASAPSPSPTQSLDDLARAVLSRTVTIESLRSGDEGLGTGWLLDSRGDFVTNAHVVAGQQTVRIRSRDGGSHAGVVLGVDTQQDVAVLRSSDGFAGAPLAVRRSPVGAVPQPVVAIASGHATGHLDITDETLTQLGQDVPVSPDTDTGATAPTATVYHDMMRFEGATIYAGNSGGPVLDASGQVVGIVTLASKSTSEGFAIPVSRVIDELLGYASQ